MENHGLINRPPQPTEWMAGGETGITPRNISDWSIYLSQGEPQSNTYFDTLACTHFASGHDYEQQIIYLWRTDQLSDEAKTFFTQFLKDPTDINSFKVSKQYSAIKGGNTKQGNYVTKAWDTWRIIGAIPDSMLNTLSTAKMWEEYYDPAQITSAMDAIAAQSLTYVDVLYNWVPYTSILELKTPLLTSPLNIGIPQMPYTNHSTVMYGIEDYAHWDLFNTYQPFQGKTDAHIGWVMQGVITPKIVPVKPKIAFKQDLIRGMRGNLVYDLQRALVDQGLLNKNLVNADPNQAFFGQNTFNAVCAFQLKYKSEILTPASLSQPTGAVHKFTLQKLNELYA